MAIHLHNTLTRRKEPLVPLRAGQVGMYVCGVTVYDHGHIGHARSAFVFDGVRRYLRHRGYTVRFVRNVTDLDDKIIDRARQEAPTASDLRPAVRAVTDRYLASFQQDMRALQIAGPDVEPRATEHLPEMIALTTALIERGLAYEAEGSVYFDVRRFPSYGRLSHQTTDQMVSQGPAEGGAGKRSPLDFALWKRARDAEPWWDSPWGRGRPGWHIECSAMSQKHLGRSFDLHCGGRDLIFPHHENEIAQSEGASGQPLARMWMHHGLLTVGGEKMAKSLGNVVTVSDIVSRWRPDVLKLVFLGSHYASPIDYTPERMEDARHALGRLTTLLEKLDALATASGPGGPAAAVQGRLEEATAACEAAMDDDVHTPRALAVVFDIVAYANHELEGPLAASPASARSIADWLRRVSGVLGLAVGTGPPEGASRVPDALASRVPAYAAAWAQTAPPASRVEGASLLDELTRVIAAPGSAGAAERALALLVEFRDHARRARCFALSDQIRSDLERWGVVLEDGKQRTLWRVPSGGAVQEGRGPS